MCWLVDVLKSCIYGKSEAAVLKVSVIHGAVSLAPPTLISSLCSALHAASPGLSPLLQGPSPTQHSLLLVFHLLKSHLRWQL